MKIAPIVVPVRVVKVFGLLFIDKLRLIIFQPDTIFTDIENTVNSQKSKSIMFAFRLGQSIWQKLFFLLNTDGNDC